MSSSTELSQTFRDTKSPNVDLQNSNTFKNDIIITDEMLTDKFQVFVKKKKEALFCR